MFKKIASNTIFQIFSKVISAVIAIFLLNILTNYLPKSEFGLYSKIYNYTGIFVFLADLGLYAITIKEISQAREKTAKIVGNVMSLRVILGIIILIFSLFLACFLDGYNSFLALKAIFIASIFTILQLINSSILALLQANMKMEIPSITFIFGKILNLFLVFLIAYYLYPKGGQESYSEAFLAIFFVATFGVAITTLLNYLYARRIVKFSFAFDWKYIQHIFWLALPYGIALFLSVVYFKMDIILLSLIEGPEKGDISIALYSLPMKVVEVIMVLAGFYMGAVLPSLSEKFQKNDTQALQKLIKISFEVLFSFALIVFVLGVLFREHLIRIIANESFLLTDTLYNSSDAFFIVFTVILFYFISVVFIYVLVASDNQKKLLKINSYVTLFNLVGNLILIPKYSFIGAGITTILSQILLFILGLFATKKLLSFQLPYMFILRNTFVGVLLFVVGSFLLKHFPGNIYFELLLYGFLIFSLYIGYLFFEYKDFILQRIRKNNL